MSASIYRSQLARKRRQRVDAEKKVADFTSKEAEKRVAARKAREVANRSSNRGTIRAKLFEASRRDKEAEAAAKEAGSWRSRATSYAQEEAKLLDGLSKAEKSEAEKAERTRKRHETVREREQDKAEADLRAQLDEAQKELMSQRERVEAAEESVGAIMRDIRAPKVERLRVLMLGASSDGGLRVAREQSRIRTAVERALHRDLIDLDARASATLDDLQTGLSRFRPHVVHFSGHSSATTVEFEKDTDAPHDRGEVASATAFARALGATDDPPLLVVLNSCNSAGQLEDLVEGVAPFAIGMTDEIDDSDAIIYATRFYTSLADGQSILAAHDSGCAALALAGLGGSDLAQLVWAHGFDPRAAVLVHPPD